MIKTTALLLTVLLTFNGANAAIDADVADGMRKQAAAHALALEELRKTKEQREKEWAAKKQKAKEDLLRLNPGSGSETSKMCQKMGLTCG